MSSSNQRPANRGFRSVLRCAISHYRQSPSLSAPEPVYFTIHPTTARAAPSAREIRPLPRPIGRRHQRLNSPGRRHRDPIPWSGLQRILGLTQRVVPLVGAGQFNVWESASAAA